MKSLSEYMTESLVNESVMGELKEWAKSYYAPSADFVQKDSMKSILKNLNHLATGLSKISELNPQQARTAALTLANYIIGVSPYSFLAEEIEEWMEIVGMDWEGDEGAEWLTELYDMIKKDTDGKVDPMSELA